MAGINTYGRLSSSLSSSSVRTYSFSIDQAVEVVNKSQGSYHEATVIYHLDDGSYVVKHGTLLNDDDNYHSLTQTVHPTDLRPLPPLAIVSPGGFSVNQKVDSYYHQGWWTATITARRGSGYYFVYCDNLDEEIEFHCSQLRVHQDWIGGCWVLT